MKIPYKFNPLAVDNSSQGFTDLTFIAKQANSTVKLTKNGSPNVSGIQYRTSTSASWSDYAINTIITLENVNDYVQFKNTANTLSTGTGSYVQFVMTGSIDGAGNVQSLMNYREDCTSYCYYRLFKSCSALNVSPEFPATTLADHCYFETLWGTSITVQPELPATVMLPYCYQDMFHSCNSLVTATSLPHVTTLAKQCWGGLYGECLSLVNAPELPLKTLAQSCYMYMFKGCTSLVKAPYLPATTLVNLCYQHMFENCNKLNEITVQFTTWNSSATSSWVNGVSSSGTFNKRVDLLSTRGSSYIPNNWTIVDDTALRFTNAKVDGASFLQGAVNGSPNISGLKYRMSMADNWETYTTDKTIRLSNLGDYVQFRNTNSTLSTSANDLFRFRGQGEIQASGNIQSLLNDSSSASDYCFSKLFYGFSPLKKAPKLPATTLGGHCYDSMFYNCIALTTAPQLPATTLGEGCYAMMFYGCSALTTAPELPATTLVTACYRYMFYKCTALTSAPILPATTLTSQCYYGMFNGCSSLNYICAYFSTWSSSTSGWVNGVSATGTFVKFPELPNETGTGKIPEGWSISNIDTSNPLIFTAKQANSTVKLNGYGTVGLQRMLYKKSTESNWKSYSNGNTITLENIDDTVSFINLENTLSSSTSNYARFAMTGQINASGNIQALLNGSTTCHAYGFWSLFRDCTALKVAPDLTATTLNTYCYNDIFRGCTGLTTAPALANVSLATHCYEGMFNGCSNLVNIYQQLPATTLASQCYQSMFEACSSLNSTPVLPATTLAASCYEMMFRNCTSLTATPTLSATTLAGNCYKQMFQGCTSLTTASDLPAITLADQCYRNMFDGCTSLVTAPEIYATSYANYACAFMFNGCTHLVNVQSELHATTIQAYGCNGMFQYCTSLVTAPEIIATTFSGSLCFDSMFRGCTSLVNVQSSLPAITSHSCFDKMFRECTSLVTPPKLPATTLANSCYKEMFYGCTSLASIQVGFTSWNNSATENWVANVSATGTFTKPEALAEQYSNYKIPTGWTVVNKE